MGLLGLFDTSGREGWALGGTDTLVREGEELVREGEETAVMAVTKGGPAPSPSSQPLGILSFLPKVQCTPLLWIKFLVFPFLWVAIPKFSL